MGRAFFDHTGDVGVRLDAPSLEGLFVEAARAFTETLTDPAAVSARATERVALAASGLDDLLVDWLDELLYRFEVHDLLVADAGISVAQTPSGWSLEGELHGEPFDAARHLIKVLVKGITYHQLNVRRDGTGWATSLVFDI